MSSESSLDLSTSPVPQAAAGTAPEVADDLVLTPPAPVKPVPTEKAATMLPLADSTATALAERARGFVTGLAAMDPRSPDFAKKVDDISKLGNPEIRASSQVSNRMLDRPVATLKGARGEVDDSQRRVADTLLDLRRQVEDLDPAKNDVSGVKRLLGLIPFGDKLRDYFAKYQSAQGNLDRIVQALLSGQDELRKDNAAIEGEKKNLWDMMHRLQEYAVLAASLDAALEEHIAQVEATDPEKANQLKSDLLFAVRQKHQDLLTQLAVAAQGYLALDLVRKNNLELIKGVDRASTTTVAALRTAVIVAQALANQKLVLDQITALNTTTSNLIVATSQMLKQQTGAIHEQAASSTVSIEALREAFDNIYETIDTIDTFKAQAVDNMAVTVDALQTEIRRAGEYLERQRVAENAPRI
ncbi:MAG: toxic anion resistance protein [Kineosporiaceae bacterium]